MGDLLTGGTQRKLASLANGVLSIAMPLGIRRARSFDTRGRPKSLAGAPSK